MKYGCSLIVRGEDATPDTFVKMAERAEALDLDSLWLSAHVVLPPQVKSGYILIPGRMHPPHWRECYWEPFTILSFLAAHTRRITLGTSVVVLPMHNPFEIAKQVAEVDQLSNGRFIFGIGVGWFEEEFGPKISTHAPVRTASSGTPPRSTVTMSIETVPNSGARRPPATTSNRRPGR